MLLTSSLFSKGSFLGAIINKCRPTTAAHISIGRPVAAVKSLEEKIGLPRRPKKPLTPYFRYMQEIRPKLQSENPKFSTIELVKLVSKKWESAEPTLKQRLQEEYKRDQQMYVEERAKYDAKISDEQRAEIKQLKQEISDAKDRKILRKRIKALGRPKKPASAFLRFIVIERKANPETKNQSYREWHKKCSEKWSRLPDDEKAIYLKEARAELDLYKENIALWEERMIRLGHTDVVRHTNLIDSLELKTKSSKVLKTT